MTELIQDLDSAESIVAQEANQFAFWAMYGRAPGCELEEGPELLRSETGLPVPVMNNVLRVRTTVKRLRGLVAETCAHFAQRGLPFRWWTGPGTRPAEPRAALERHGLRLAVTMPMMALALDALPEEPPGPPGLDVGLVENEPALRDWARVVTACFGFPDAAYERAVALELSLGFDPQGGYFRFVGYRGAAPVATAALLLAEGVAGIYTVAVLPEARRQGAGAALTLAALREARRRGYRVGTLQSTPMGRSVYQGLGFRELAPCECYIWQPEGFGGAEQPH